MFELKLKIQNKILKHKLRKNQERVGSQVRESSIVTVASCAILKLLVLCFFGVVILFPFILMISISLMTPSESLALKSEFHIFPYFTEGQINGNQTVPWAQAVQYNYYMAWSDGYLKAVGYTSANVLLSVVLKVFITLLMGYAFSLRNWRGKNVAWFFALSLLVLPEVALMSGQYYVVKQLGLNTNAVLFIIAIAVPFVASVFNATMYKNAFESIPGRIKEVSLVDGATGAKYLFKVAFPMVLPTTLTIIILTAFAAWNTYLWASLVDPSGGKNYPVISTWLFKAGIKNDVTNTGTPEITPSIKMAASIFAILPMVIVYFIFRKRIMNAISRQGSTIKG